MLACYAPLWCYYVKSSNPSGSVQIPFVCEFAGASRNGEPLKVLIMAVNVAVLYVIYGGLVRVAKTHEVS